MIYKVISKNKTQKQKKQTKKKIKFKVLDPWVMAALDY